MTTIYELMENMTQEIEQLDTMAAVDEAKLILVKALAENIIGAEVKGLAYGTGFVAGINGTNLDDAIVDIAFITETRHFSLKHLITNSRFVKFTDENVYSVLETATQVHNMLISKTYEFNRAERQHERAEAKRLLAEKKAADKYEQMKANAIKDFEALTKTKKTFTEADEFYFTLGWLTKHIGTLSAAMPDYLENAFVSHFGSDTPHKIVDSKKRTIGGFPTQWALSFRASLTKATYIPATLTQYLNPTGNAVTNTAFIWDLVDNYGFCFGKKQNKETILGYIPNQCLDSFEDGWNA